MRNPFVYGKEVEGDNFCDREGETKELCRDIFNSQNVIIFSQRRFGKTSLVKRVLNICRKKGIITIYVDLFPALSEEDFVNFYGKAILEATQGKVKSTLAKATTFFKKLRPTATVEPSGNISWGVDMKGHEIMPALEDVLESINRVIYHKKKKAVVCFDEFQQIGLFKTDKIQKMMRSVMQRHHNISYIFMGSKKHLIFDIFNNPNKPFYKSGKSFPLKKIEDDKILKFVSKKFEQTRIKISDELIKEVIHKSESHPYYIQYLCHIVWERAVDKKRVSKQDILECINTLLMRESSTYEVCWDSLTIRQRQTLIALAKGEKSEQIYSEEYRKKHSLGTTSTLDRTLKSLIDKDLIDKEKGSYSIIDVFFKKWLDSL